MGPKIILQCAKAGNRASPAFRPFYCPAGRASLAAFRALALAVVLLLVPAAAHAAIQLTGGLTKEFEVEPGRSYEGSIEIKNPEDGPREVKAFQTDYFFYADGRALYEEAGSQARSNAPWIIVSPSQVVIPAGETVSIHFSIQVPDDATMKGTYWSTIIVEPVPESSPESTLNAATEPGLGIRQTLRYAVQIVTHIGTTGSRSLKFNQVALKSEEGKRILNIDAENTGERWLRGSLWMELYDSSGVSLGKFDGGRQRMYPGTSARFTVDLTDVKGATYKALVVVDCGGDDVFGANLSLALTE